MIKRSPPPLLHYLVPLILCAAGVAVFFRGFRAPFLFDDIGSVDTSVNTYYRAIGDNPPVKFVRESLFAGRVGDIFAAIGHAPLSKWWETPKSIVASLWTALHVPDGQTVTGRPLVSFSLGVSYALSGDPASGGAMWGYHVLNLLMHLGNALLVYGIVRRTLLRPVLVPRFGAAAVPLALSVALLWLVHPLHANSVTYIITRTELLVSLFFLLTFYCAIRAWESPDRSWAWMILAVLACTVGMATKENMVTVPVLLWLYDRTFYSRRSWGAWGLALGALVPLGVLLAAFPSILLGPAPATTASGQIGGGDELRGLLQCLGVLVATAGAGAAVACGLFFPGAREPKDSLLRRNFVLFFLVAASWTMLACLSASQKRPATGFDLPVTSFQYFRTQGGVILFYLHLALFPNKLAIYHEIHIAMKWWQWVPQCAAMIGLLGLTGWALVRRPVLGFLGAWFFIILSPTSTFIPVYTETGAERRMYLSLLSLILLGVCGGYRLLGWAMTRWGLTELPVRRALLATPVALAAAGLGLVGFLHIEVYASIETVWRDVVDKYPDCAFGWNNLGVDLASQHRYAEAIDACSHAVIAKPTNNEAWTNLDVLIEGFSPDPTVRKAKGGDVFRSITQAAKNLDDPAQARQLKFLAYYKLGDFSLKPMMEDLGEAEEAFKQARVLEPEHAHLCNSLGIVYYKRGLQEQDTARREQLFQTALGYFSEAVLKSRKAKDPEIQAIAYLNLAWLSLDRQNMTDAFQKWRDAAGLKPQSPEALGQLAEMALRLGDASPAPDDKIARYSDALNSLLPIVNAKKAPPPLLQKLGLAYFRLGNLPAARDATAESLRLKPEATDARAQLIDILLAWGDAEAKKGQPGVVEYQNALSYCLTVVGQANTLPLFYVRASMAYFRLSRLDEAEQAARAACNSTPPGFLDARVQLVEVLIAKGDRRAASGQPAADIFKEAYDVAAETVKNLPPTAGRPHLHLAKLLLRLGRLDDAETEARQIKDPNLAAEVEQLLAAIRKARSSTPSAP